MRSTRQPKFSNRTPRGSPLWTPTPRAIVSCWPSGGRAMGAPHPIRVYQGDGERFSEFSGRCGSNLVRQSAEDVQAASRQCGRRLVLQVRLPPSTRWSSLRQPRRVNPWVPLRATFCMASSAASFSISGAPRHVLSRHERAHFILRPAINVSGSNAVGERLRSLSDFCCFFRFAHLSVNNLPIAAISSSLAP